MSISLAFSRRDGRLADALKPAVPPLLFALRLWASVCLALYIAFWLQLDNPFWAGTSAAIVCQPQLGAALRKGWFRMIGTVIGATMIVALTALFPQDRIGFLALLAVWGSICAFIATLLRNFASYGAALAGYTAVIIAADTLGATGGASPNVFWIAVWRASEICIGIACAGLVLGLTDLGGAQRRLAASFASLAAEFMERFTRMLALAGPQLPDTLDERREFVRRVIALDPMIDQALGESGHARADAPTLQTAVYGLIRALDGWRGVARHLTRSRDERERQEAATILRSIPPELRSATEPGASTRWLADPMALRRLTVEAASKLLALPAGTPSLRLLADETAKVVAGMSRVLDGLALLVDAPDRSPAVWPRLFLGRAGLAARLYQCGASLRRDRRGRAFLGRDRLAERRLCDRLRSRHGSAALAERRHGLWGRHRVRARHGRQRLLCGDHQICAAASPRDVPGLLCRHRSYSRTGQLCHGVGPEQAEARTCGRVHPLGRELPAAARAHQPDDLRHRRFLQYRDGDRDRMLHRPAGVQLDPAVVAGTADAPPARAAPCAISAASQPPPGRRGWRIGRAACMAGSRRFRIRPSRCSAPY